MKNKIILNINTINNAIAIFLLSLSTSAFSQNVNTEYQKLNQIVIKTDSNKTNSKHDLSDTANQDLPKKANPITQLLNDLKSKYSEKTIKIAVNENELYENTKAKYGSSDARTLSSLNNYAVSIQKKGRIKTSIPLFEQALKQSIQDNGMQNLKTLNIMNNYANALLEMGALQDASSYFDKVRKGKIELLGLSHSDTLSATNNYANSLQAIGKYSEATSLLKNVVKWRIEIAGERDEETLSAMNNYANALESLGKLKDSLHYYTKTLELRKQVLGESHQDTFISYNNYGYILQKLGKYTDAKEQFEKAIKIKNIVGDDHPLYLEFRNNYAVNMESLGESKKALAIYEEILKQRLEISGENHPDTLIAYNNYASALKNNKQIDEAVPFYEKSFKLAQEVLGTAHPQTLIYLENYISGLKAAGYTTDYENYQRKLDKMKADVSIYAGIDSNLFSNMPNLTLKNKRLLANKKVKKSTFIVKSSKTVPNTVANNSKNTSYIKAKKAQNKVNKPTLSIS